MITKITLAILAAAAIGLTVSWSTGTWESPQLKEIRKLQKEIQQTREKPSGEETAEVGQQTAEEEARNETRQETIRREKWAEYREKVKELPEDQRKSVETETRNQFLVRIEKRIDRVLLLPPGERNAELDKQIDEGDKRRKRWQQEREAKQSENNGSSKTTGNNRWRTASTEQRNQWRRQMLAYTTPKQRAKFQEYRRLMNHRRKERGMPERGGHPF